VPRGRSAPLTDRVLVSLVVNISQPQFFEHFLPERGGKFVQWFDGLRNVQPENHNQIITAVRDFIDTYESRFAPFHLPQSVGIEKLKRPPLIHELAGYWEDDKDGKRVYLFYPAALKTAPRQRYQTSNQGAVRQEGIQ
jgi:hypothetical protein